MKRTFVAVFGCLAAFLAPFVAANGQDRIADLETSERLLWSDVYANGGTSLYCAKGFTGSSELLTASAVYSIKQLKASLRCITDRQCSIMNPRYPYIEADLHNLYPALKQIEQARRNAQFADLPDDTPNKFADIGCELKSAFRKVEPRDAAKGNIARAMFYMHIEYDLPITGQAQLLKQWHQLDPPDAEEKARNDKIEQLQGTRNRFIDDPALVDKLIAD